MIKSLVMSIILIIGGALVVQAEETGAAAASVAEGSSTSASPAAGDSAKTVEKKTGSSLAEQMAEGGWIVIILILISVAMVTFAIERIINLQQEKFIPPGLASDARVLWSNGDHAGIVKRCAEAPSTLATILTSLAKHNHISSVEASNIAGDIASQDMRTQMQKIIPFALIATISPLLGLLGTVSGMIESFEVVSVAGSLGDASMLAGGISHALVTTAAGLIVAVPAIALFNIYKIMTNKLTLRLEGEVNQLINEWFLSDKDEKGVA